MESFLGLAKSEFARHTHFATHKKCKQALF